MAQLSRSSWCSALLLVLVLVAHASGQSNPPNLGPWIDVTQIPTGSAGFNQIRVANTTQAPGPSEDGTGNFRTVCGFSHMNFDDPIVFPGQPGRSHLHVFFGNTLVTGHTTATSLATTGNSTCRGGIINRSGYWVPAIIDTRSGKPVAPADSHFYYKTGYNGISPSEINVPPQGLRMIVGDPTRSTPASDYGWVCVGDGITYQKHNRIPSCPVGSELWMSLRFPQCWDGVNLDSPNHKSHMSRTVNGDCPATHPVAIPEITFNIVYSITEENTGNFWRLASDNYTSTLPPGYSAHADWFNGWKEDFMTTFVNHCDRAAVNCFSHLLGDGKRIY